MAELTEHISGRSHLKRKLAERFLAPIVAGAASAAAGYAVRNGPQLVEQKLLPKLREAAGGVGSKTQAFPSHAKSVKAEAAGVAERLVDQALATVGRTQTLSPGNGRSSGPHARKAISTGELERRLEARAHGRAQRRGAKSR